MVEDEVMLPRHRAWQRTLFVHGWGALTWPKEYGGRGVGPIEQIISNQELSRLGLGASLFLMTLACHIAGNFGSLCFATFSVTCSVALADVVLPLGWVAIGLFTAGCLTFYFYGKGASRRARKVLEAESNADMVTADAVTEIGGAIESGGRRGRGAVNAVEPAGTTAQDPARLPGAVTEQVTRAVNWSDDETPPGSVSSYGEEEDVEEGKPWDRM